MAHPALKMPRAVSEPASPLSALARPLAIVAHDAGGAELLSSLLRRAGLGPGTVGGRGLRFALDGPARAVFERKLGPIPNLPLTQALDGAASLLCGTGWQAMLEFDALRGARERGMMSIAFLDHWTNYRERFVRGGLRCLPDALWVGDEHALVMARQRLPELPVALLPNPYLADLLERVVQLTTAAESRTPSRHSAGLRFLYVSEPLREAALRQHGSERHWGYTEEEALQYALERLPQLGVHIAQLVLRPHPSEAPDKYDALLARSSLPVSRGGARELLAEVAECDVVVGCNSMAMVIGLLAGKRVLCAIPPGGSACALPQRTIQMLRETVTLGERRSAAAPQGCRS